MDTRRIGELTIDEFIKILNSQYDTLLNYEQVPIHMAIDGTYPKIEELTFRTYVTSEEQARILLVGIQALVNAIGAESIIQAVSAIEKNPSLLSKGMSYLPTLMKFI